ncbi:MAG: hypothetical protein KY451_14255 [Actinobacteria bacterium]|nr:hypothetical protein [Actinomycetota bacterium]
MSEDPSRGRGEESPEPGREVPRGDDDRTAAAAQPDDEWAAADALLLGQPTVLGEPGGW